MPIWLKHSEVKNNIYTDIRIGIALRSCQVPLKYRRVSLCLGSQIFCNIWWEFWCNLEIEKIVRPSSYCTPSSWHVTLLGKYSHKHTASVTASPGTHAGGLHSYSCQPSLPLCKVIFLFPVNSVFFVPVRSLVALISCLCPFSCSSSSALCWRSTRGLRLMPNYRKWRWRIRKTRRELPGWLSGFGKTRNLRLLHLTILFTHCSVFRVRRLWKTHSASFISVRFPTQRESCPSWFHVLPQGSMIAEDFVNTAIYPH